MKILLTGGAGYIGSHTAVVLLSAGFDVVILDNLSNSSEESIKRITDISGRKPEFIYGDVTDSFLLKNIFSNYSFEAVIHFAGLKSVANSTFAPLDYYHTNVQGSILLLKSMLDARVLNFIFSSSATVYSQNASMPVAENSSLGDCTNPYGKSKLMVEDILRDLSFADSRIKIGILRYFNPIGAHPSGVIGENPLGIPDNLVPYISQVATGKLSELSVYGNDYATKDGTGVRDYIHVLDLAEGHLQALRYIQSKNGVHVWNLGSGLGYSVFDVISAFEHASGKKIPYSIKPRRPGDRDICYANISKASSELLWKPKRTLANMMTDVWNWQVNNPNGY